MKIARNEVHARIKELLISKPQNFENHTEISEWMTKADVLVETLDHDGENAEIEDAIYDIKAGFVSEQSSKILSGLIGIRTVLIRCMYRLELTENITPTDKFIPAGNELDAMTIIGNIFSDSIAVLMIIDPYMDETLFTDFLRYVNDEVELRLLCSSRKIDEKISAPLKRWCSQYPKSRIEVRFCKNNVLHDRLIIVDQKEIWLLSQSLNGIAKRSHAYVVQPDVELSELKRNSYMQIWESAEKFSV